MYVFKLKENYKHSELLYRNNTRELFYYAGDIATDTEEKTYKELVELVQSGKIAVFPIWKKQKWILLSIIFIMVLIFISCNIKITGTGQNGTRKIAWNW